MSLLMSAEKQRDIARTCLESWRAFILNTLSLIRNISKSTFYSMTLSLGYAMHNIK